MNNTVETLFNAYLEGEGMTDLNKTLSEVSGEVDKRMENGVLTSEDLAGYEEAAARAAFYAGFTAAISSLKAAL